MSFRRRPESIPCVIHRLDGRVWLDGWTPAFAGVTPCVWLFSVVTDPPRVVPAKAGTQLTSGSNSEMDSRFRGNDTEGWRGPQVAVTPSPLAGIRADPQGQIAPVERFEARTVPEGRMRGEPLAPSLGPTPHSPYGHLLPQGEKGRPADIAAPRSPTGCRPCESRDPTHLWLEQLQSGHPSRLSGGGTMRSMVGGNRGHDARCIPRFGDTAF